jgi:hypothetical protein
MGYVGFVNTIPQEIERFSLPQTNRRNSSLTSWTKSIMLTQEPTAKTSSPPEYTRYTQTELLCNFVIQIT